MSQLYKLILQNVMGLGLNLLDSFHSILSDLSPHPEDLKLEFIN